jgi:hypothetical protein
MAERSTSVICEACALKTDRLLVEEWHSLSRDDDELARHPRRRLEGALTTGHRRTQH